MLNSNKSDGMSKFLGVQIHKKKKKKKKKKILQQGYNKCLPKRISISIKVYVECHMTNSYLYSSSSHCTNSTKMISNAQLISGSLIISDY